MKLLGILLGVTLLVGGASGFNGDPQQVGLASWYGPGFHGRQTASGERFDQNALTMAHRDMKFGTCVRVTRLDVDRSVLVRVNDRGPYVAPRIADLSRGAAEELGMVDRGLADVRLEPLRTSVC